ncbi:MAG: TetM/TetW/TetO/TetS family tetracycline resistance ribosomal protection protein [Lachnospiraceae bacterium]|nr:TetM/TetW/TetO/TetS family tetracycline resistance ribosomal protection protein [Lachnospiraceae bacterium]
MQNQISLGILAHVDAGKTTLSENILLHTGVIRSAGRVDRGDTHLDTDEMERERGITIFTRQAVFPLGEETQVTLLDTPGHVDFTPEMERTLKVLDAAVLLISAREGVNGHVRAIWKLLEHYGLPVLVFVNKMDQTEGDHTQILRILRSELSEGAVDFSGALPREEMLEEAAVLDEELMERVLLGEEPSEEDLMRLFRERKLFPVWFGSALRDEGVDDLLAGMQQFLPGIRSTQDEAEKPFGALVYKITRENGQRLTFMKITSGTLKVRQPVQTEEDEEKVTELRIYSGDRYTAIPEAVPGMIAAVPGLVGTHVGQGLGTEADAQQEQLQPILSCVLQLPPGTDLHHAFQDLKKLEEEEPMLHLRYDEETKEIAAEVYGQVQIEILTRRIRERFGYDVTFGPGRIVYRETIRSVTEGVGHFEPLRHYAEVHLRMEPLSPGSGLQFDSECPVNLLARNWQRLILTHLQERVFYGVLTKSVITDMRIVLTGGRAHEKHTEGGDFRKATYRAVRQGLMMAENLLLEPVYEFELRVPAAALGKALTDLQLMDAAIEAPEVGTDFSVVRGTVPAAALLKGTGSGFTGGYAAEVAAYTRGEGSLATTLKGYAPCKNAEEVIAAAGYDPEADVRNPSSSVFCSHGVGTIVPWDRVRDYMHVDTGFRFPWESKALPEADAGYEVSRAGLSAGETERADAEAYSGNFAGTRQEPETFEEQKRAYDAQEEDLKRIFERTYGPIVEKRVRQEEKPREFGRVPAPTYRKPQPPREHYLLVDGYNIIFAWEELKRLAIHDIKAARDRLMDILSNYAGYRGENVILVFDAYKVRGGTGEVSRFHNIDVVYTRQAETADLYIEKTAHVLSKKYHVTVATSDAIEQVIILGAGAVRMSADGLLEEVRRAENEIREKYTKE